MKTYDRDALTTLLGAVKELKDASDGYVVLYFHLSRLSEQFRSEYQIRIALNILSDSLKRESGALFLLYNSDIVMLYAGSDRGLLERSVFQLRYLFMDDTLAYSEDGYENEEFCRLYDLTFQWRAFYEKCLSLVKEDASLEAERETQTEPEESRPDVSPRPSPRTVAEPPAAARARRLLLTPGYLKELTDWVSANDISPCFRMQPVCLYNEDTQEYGALYRELFVNISHLESLLPQPLDVRSNRLLFIYLTEYLDRSVLQHMAGAMDHDKGQSVSINLNCRSLITDAFARFDASVPEDLKKRIIIEIHLSDIFSDFHGFVVTRGILRHKGYRLCVDGLDADTLHLVDRKALGVDMLKIAWSQDLLHPEVSQAAERAVAAAKGTRVVLCRCDKEQALDWGKATGFRLFQGRLLDSIVEPDSGVTN